MIVNTVDGFIFVGINFRGWSKNHTFVGFKIRGHSILLHYSYRKCFFLGPDHPRKPGKLVPHEI